MDAIILAGSPNNGPLRGCSDEHYEALIKIDGKPMIRYVVDALLECGEINRIAVSGPAELKDIFHENRLRFSESEGTVIGNTIKALAMVDHTQPVLIATCDIPLLTAKAVEDFVRLSSGGKADFYYPIVSMEGVDRLFPEVKRTSVKLIEGTFTGGNLFIVNPDIILRCAARAQEFINCRKSPLKLSRLLGLKFVFKLLMNRLSIPELEEKVAQLFGISVKAVITTFPEIGIDIDKPSDYEIIAKYLDKSA